MECGICKSQFVEGDGKQCTPREIAQKKPVMQGDLFDEFVSATALYGVASNIVQFDNPKGGADLPAFQVCSKCLKAYFGIVSIGTPSHSAPTPSHSAPTPKAEKKWWQFWK